MNVTVSKNQEVVVLTFRKAQCSELCRRLNKFTWPIGHTRQCIWGDVWLLWMVKLLLTRFVG